MLRRRPAGRGFTISLVAQALVARFAPSDMRGRYMALYGFSWIIPTAVGPLLAGLIMDNYNPDWVWYAAGILALIAAAGLLGLHPSTQKRLEKQAATIPLEVNA